MEHMSALDLAQEKFRSGMLRKAQSSEACMAMILVLALWDGTNILCQLVLDQVLSSTTMYESQSTRLLS
jgi:hypothetical protein